VAERRLAIAAELELPLDAVTQKLAFIGRTGSGKTYAATALAERMLEAGAQAIALDPVGVWWGLRLAADGRSPGVAIPVFGGLHGDVPLEASAGSLIADLVVDRAISAVLDVSQFEHDSDKARFARDFAARFFYRKKAAPSAVHLFLEECQEFIPQNLMRGEEQMLHAFQRLVRLGRNFGIGASLISQRPQDVNKKALNQTECVFAFQMTGPHERKAVEGWIAEKGLDQHLADGLPKLRIGQAHVWSPGWLRMSQLVQIAAKRTFNASSTPEVGREARARELAPIDLERIRQQMAATIARAEAEDPKKLRGRIAHLERELKSKPAPAPAAAPKRVEISVLKPADMARLETVTQKLEAALAGLRSDLSRVRIMPVTAPAGTASAGSLAAAPRPRGIGRVLAEPGSDRPRPGDGGVPQLDKAARAILAVVIQHPEGCGASRLALLAGYRWSGGFRNALSGLRANGMIVGSNTEVMRVTIRGQMYGANVEPLPDGEELIRYWMNHRALGQCERELLRVLTEIYPSRLTAEQLAERSGYAWSGGFRNALSKLRTAGLIQGRNSEGMRASQHLFPGRSA